jgi:hypothetical protein
VVTHSGNHARIRASSIIAIKSNQPPQGEPDAAGMKLPYVPHIPNRHRQRKLSFLFKNSDQREATTLARFSNAVVPHERHLSPPI